jgi:hypothetical protein
MYRDKSRQYGILQRNRGISYMRGRSIFFNRNIRIKETNYAPYSNLDSKYQFSHPVVSPNIPRVISTAQFLKIHAHKRQYELIPRHSSTTQALSPITHISVAGSVCIFAVMMVFLVVQHKLPSTMKSVRD